MVAVLSSLVPHEKVCQFREVKCQHCPHICTAEKLKLHTSCCPTRYPCIARCLSRHGCTGMVGLDEYFLHVKQAGCREVGQNEGKSRSFGYFTIQAKRSGVYKFETTVNKHVEEIPGQGPRFKGKDIGKMWSFVHSDGMRMYLSHYRIDSQKCWLFYLTMEAGRSDAREYKYVMKVANRNRKQDGGFEFVRQAMTLEESVPGLELFEHGQVATVADGDMEKMLDMGQGESSGLVIRVEILD